MNFTISVDNDGNIIDHLLTDPNAVPEQDTADIRWVQSNLRRSPILDYWTGEDWLQKEFLDPTEEQSAAVIEREVFEVTAAIRYTRRGLLTECDWTQLPDSPLSDSEKLQWATYRQELRDLTNFPEGSSFSDIVWPTPPSTQDWMFSTY